MKIAIVGPSPIPYTVGGAENLMWGLCEHINTLTTHQAELIKVPVDESNFWSLIESYYKFYTMDLSHFDLIISSKYPSWMVRHDKRICYMMHTLRGLYDTYHLTQLPLEVPRTSSAVNRVLDYMEKYPSYDDFDEFFKLLFSLRETADQIPKHFFSFPGPFIRAIIHYLDHGALTQRGRQQYFAISDTVKNRQDYFPLGAQVKTLYPPTVLKQAYCAEYKHVFMISRLDGPKRIDMLIKAMKYVKSDVKLFIAGTGPEKDALEKLAKGDPRIKFLGFISDEDAENYYANSLVVPYFPYDEDYGYITVEAMLHKKPVITTVDAGGPNEFVFDNETGFVTEFSPEAIGEKIQFFATHPEEAKRMGEKAYLNVKGITWESMIPKLFGEKATVIGNNLIHPQKSSRKKMTVISTFSIYPPMGGGQVRVYNLYKNVAKTYDVEIVSFAAMNESYDQSIIAPGMIETKVPKSERHENAELRMRKKINRPNPITDIGMISLSGETPAYGRALKKSIENSELVVISHPFLYPEARKYMEDKPFVYEAQDVESVIKKKMLPDTAYAKKLVQQIYDVEKECCEKSLFVMTCSKEDQDTLHELYDTPYEKMIIVPNGVDSGATHYTSIDERLKNKEKLGLEKETLGLFMGSWHQPNLEACEEIFKIAMQCPNVKFLLMGSQCPYFMGRQIPKNVGMLGVVSEEEKNKVFSAVDFALNPMLSGSGTNLKMFDYMSAGIPVITTPFGTRGIDNKDLFILSEVREMVRTVKNFKLHDQQSRVEEARDYVEKVFDWSVISESMVRRVHNS